MNWISVKERLPEDNSVVLVHYVRDEYRPRLAIADYCQWHTPDYKATDFLVNIPKLMERIPDHACTDSCGMKFSSYEFCSSFDHEQVTHWMPLPEPAETKRETE